MAKGSGSRAEGYNAANLQYLVDQQKMQMDMKHRSLEQQHVSYMAGVGVGTSPLLSTVPFNSFAPATYSYIHTLNNVYYRQAHQWSEYKIPPSTPAPTISTEEALEQMSRKIKEAELRVEAMIQDNLERENRLADQWKARRRHEAQIRDVKAAVRSDYNDWTKHSDALGRAMDQSLHHTIRDRLLATPTRGYLKEGWE